MLTLNALLAEQANIIAAAPADMSGASGLTTGWISLKAYKRATVVLIKNAAASGVEHPVITIQQASAVAGTGAKDLAKIARIDKKTHATAVSGVGTYTAVTQAAGATFTGVSTEQAIYQFDVLPEMLDVANGFDCIQATIADVGTVAQLGCLFVILWADRYSPPLTPLTD